MVHASLKNSILYSTLTEDIDENKTDKINKVISQSVPAKCKFTEIKIESVDDFTDTMEIMRYWQSKELPIEIYDYLINNYMKNKQVIDYVLRKQFYDFFNEDITKFLKYMAARSCSPFSVACDCGNLIMIKALVKNKYHLMPHEKKYQSLFFLTAVNHSYLHIVKYFAEEVDGWDCKVDRAKLSAIVHDDLEMLKYLHSLNPDVTPTEINKYLLRESTRTNNYEIFSFLHEKGYYVCEDIHLWADLTPKSGPEIMKALEGIKV